MSAPDAAGSDEPVDVAVIGAGLAGLRAATELVAAGRDVVVLEARDRVGGRVWSHRFEDGQWCERGAEFVDTAHTELLALADRLDIARTPVPSGRDDAARLIDAGGRAIPFSLHHSLDGELARWTDAVDRLADRLDDRLEGVDLLDATGAAGRGLEDLDVSTVAELIAGLDLAPMARVVIGRDIRTEYMLSPDDVSQLMLAWMTSLHRLSPDGCESIRLAGGNDRLATGLAAPLGARVRLGTEVRSIDPATGHMRLASGASIIAEHVVATLPLPVLARVWSDIPAELSSVGYGIGGKVSVQYGRRVWLDEGRDGSVRTERAWGELWETTDGQSGDAGVLTALLSSNDGAALVALPDVERRIVAEVERLFSGSKGLAGERVRTDWTNDEHSLGGYAAFGPYQLLRAAPFLRRRYGRMLLAGEHTDRWCGYMEGALRSGARAAARVLAGD